MKLTEYTREHFSLTNGAYLAILNLLLSSLFIHLWQFKSLERILGENILVTIGLIMGGIIVLLVLMMANNQRHQTLLALFTQSLSMLLFAFLLSIYLFYPHQWLDNELIRHFGNPIAYYFVIAVFSGYSTFFRLNIARVYSVDQRTFAFLISPFIVLPLLGLAFVILKAFLDVDELDLNVNLYDVVGTMTIVITLYSFISLKLYRVISYNRNIFIFLTQLAILAYIGLYFYVIL